MGRGNNKSATRPMSSAAIATAPVAKAEAFVQALFNKNSTEFYSEDEINPNKNQPSIIKYSNTYRDLEKQLQNTQKELDELKRQLPQNNNQSLTEKAKIVTQIASLEKDKFLLNRSMNNEFKSTNPKPVITLNSVKNISTKNLMDIREKLKLREIEKWKVDGELVKREIMNFSNILHPKNMNKEYYMKLLKKYSKEDLIKLGRRNRIYDVAGLPWYFKVDSNIVNKLIKPTYVAMKPFVKTNPYIAITALATMYLGAHTIQLLGEKAIIKFINSVPRRILNRLEQ